MARAALLADFAASSAAVEVVAVPALASDDARLPVVATGTPTDDPLDAMLLAFSTVCALMTMLPPERMPASPASIVPAGAKR